jgi:hypothetical protein
VAWPEIDLNIDRPGSVTERHVGFRDYDRFGSIANAQPLGVFALQPSIRTRLGDFFAEGVL